MEAPRRGSGRLFVASLALLIGLLLGVGGALVLSLSRGPADPGDERPTAQTGLQLSTRITSGQPTLGPLPSSASETATDSPEDVPPTSTPELEPPLPTPLDLAVVNLAVEPAAPVAGIPFMAVITVINQADAPTIPFEIEFAFVDSATGQGGQARVSAAPLPVGETLQAQAEWQVLCPSTVDVSATLLLPTDVVDRDIQDNSTAMSVSVTADPNTALDSRCPGTEPEARPDLAVSMVEVLPGAPIQNTPMGYRVYATNLGNAPTGDFKVQVLVLDVDHGSTYPDDFDLQPELQPGESRLVDSYDSFYATCAGSHQIRVELTVPDGDSNPTNNVLIYPFTVQAKTDGVPCS